MSGPFAFKVMQKVPLTFSGLGAFQLDPTGVGAWQPWSTEIADGVEVFFYVENEDGSLWERYFGTFHSNVTPNTVSRDEFLGSSTGSPIDWQSSDVASGLYVYSVADSAALNHLLAPFVDGTDNAPGWLPVGARVIDNSDTSTNIWPSLRKITGGDTPTFIEDGRYHVDKGIFAGNGRRASTAVGATTKTFNIADVGGSFTFDNSAVDLAATLPKGSDVGDGYSLELKGLSTAHGIVLTPDAGDGIDGRADGATKTIPGGVLFTIRWSAADDSWLTNYRPVFAGVRQTVAAGPLTTAGLPNFLPSTDADLNLGSQNITSGALFVAAAAKGWGPTGQPADAVGYSASDLIWNGLTASRAAATPNFLYVTINADGSLTPGSTTVAPIHQWAGTPATTAGQFTFNIAEMKGYMGNGSAAPQANIVFVGEAATDGTGVISTVAYAYNGRYDSGFTATLFATATEQVKNHNIGTAPGKTALIVECTTAQSPWAVGDQISTANGVLHSTTSSGTAAQWMGIRTTAKTIGFSLGADGVFAAIAPSTGNGTTLTTTSWKYKFVAERGW